MTRAGAGTAATATGPAGRVLGDDTVGTVRLGEREVRRLGFGVSRISDARGAEGAHDRAESVRLCRRAYERGVRFFDTADVYGSARGMGNTEEIIAEALHPYPDDVVIGTKAGFRPGLLQPGHTTMVPLGTPENIRTQCEKSLRTLRLDCLDLYLLHVPDPALPFADTVGVFAELREEGKIRSFGVSNVSLEQLEIARSVLPVVAVQNRYNAADRASEDVLDACSVAGIAFLPWRPVALTRNRAGRTVDEVATALGVPVQHVALAWLLRRAPEMLPIPGTSKLAHLESNIDAAWLELSSADYDRIDEAAAL